MTAHSEPEPTMPQRPDARRLRGESEFSHEQAERSPGDRLNTEASEDTRRRDDISVAPEDIAARFLSDAVEGDPSPREAAGRDADAELPVAEDEEELRDRSRADLPPHATPEGEGRHGV